jgi:hypothetical protein
MMADPLQSRFVNTALSTSSTSVAWADVNAGDGRGGPAVAAL